MRKFIGWIVAVGYALAGARCRVVRRLRFGGMLPVVAHALPASELEKILAWLKRRGVLDRLWLSFDDGWATVKDCLPVLEKFGVRAKVFVAPGETMRGNVWTEEAIQLGVPSEVWRSWYPLSEADRYAKLDGYATGSTRQKTTLLTKEEIVQLSRSSMVDVENHTWSHVSAPHRPVDEVVEEVKRAQAMLTEWTGRAPEWLAWPFGRGTPELDARVAALGLKTVYTKQGYEVGGCRNMALEGVSFQENLGRILGAWPKVGETL